MNIVKIESHVNRCGGCYMMPLKLLLVQLQLT